MHIVCLTANTVYTDTYAGYYNTVNKAFVGDEQTREGQREKKPLEASYSIPSFSAQITIDTLDRWEDELGRAHADNNIIKFY